MGKSGGFFCRRNLAYAAVILSVALAAALNLAGIYVFIPLLILTVLFIVDDKRGFLYLSAALACALMSASRAGFAFNLPAELQYTAKVCVALSLLALSLYVMRVGGGPDAILYYILKRSQTRRGFFGAVVLTSSVFSFIPEIGSSIGAGLYAEVGKKMGISREKVAMLSNLAASVVSGTFLLTLIAPQVLDAVKVGLDAAGGGVVQASVFMRTLLPFMYFPISAAVVMFMSCSKLRDIGGILSSERKARKTVDIDNLKAFRDGKARKTVDIDNLKAFRDGKAHKKELLLCVIPVALMLFLIPCFARLGFTWADNFTVGAAAMLLCALLIIALNKDFSKIFAQQFNMGKEEFRHVGVSLLALLLSAAVVSSDCCGELVELIQCSAPLAILPSLIAITACALAFLTGSRTAAMLLVLPLVIPRTWFAMQESIYLTMSTAAAVSGAIAGGLMAPHCPTNILAAAFAGCPLQRHMKSQSLYALVMLACACLLGFLPVSIGFTTPFGLLTAVVGSYAIFDTISKSPDAVNTR